MKALFAREAQTEFEEAQCYYEHKEAGLGEAFAESVRQGLRLVSAQPVAGRIEFEDVRRVILKRFPYKLLYIVESDHLMVVAVAHQRRQPHYWLSRIAKNERLWAEEAQRRLAAFDAGRNSTHSMQEVFGKDDAADQ